MRIADAPVLDPTGAAALVAERRAAGLRIALANGCFDLLHVGHVRYLRAARREADFLVVALNDDASVRAARGPGRPLLPGAARARMVAALAPVDAVTLFAEPTADRLIRLLRPDVHCKGPDYAGGVPETATVLAIGGRVAIVGDPKDHGTTELIARIRRGWR